MVLCAFCETPAGGGWALNLPLFTVLTKGGPKGGEGIWGDVLEFLRNNVEGLKQVILTEKGVVRLEVSCGIDYTVTIRLARRGAIERLLIGSIKDWNERRGRGAKNRKSNVRRKRGVKVGDVVGRLLTFLKSSRYVIAEVLPSVQPVFIPFKPEILAWEDGPKRAATLVRYWGQTAKILEDTGISGVVVLNEHVTVEDFCVLLNRFIRNLTELISPDSLYGIVEAGGAG
jgi:hypothetical protein